jgi:dTMP kinase
MRLFRKTNPTTPPKPRGKLIVLEGIDGTGKSTQTTRLAEIIEQTGHHVVTISFPQYDLPTGDLITRHLKNGEFADASPQAISTMYALDRFAACPSIKQELEAGSIVIATRYTISNAAYQGAKLTDPHDRIAFFKWLDTLEHTYLVIPRPNLNIVLHVNTHSSHELIQQRAQKTGDTLHLYEKNQPFLETVNEIYAHLAELYPNTKMVECMDNGKLLDEQTISNRVWDLVRRLVLK